MRKYRFRKAFIANVITLMMVFSLLGGLFPMTAYADDPECNLTLTITPDSVTLPASVTLSGTATDYYSGAPIINGRVVFRGYGDFGVTYTDENGDYSYIWTLPSDMPSDTYHIQADLDYYSDDAYADLTVSAPTWTITASAGAHGSISPSGEVSVDEGADQTFTFTPDTDYYMGEVLIDGVSVGVIASYTFHNVTSNHTIVASFTDDIQPPAAPTNPVTDDLNNTFGWTNTPGYSNPSDYEYTKNGGTTWNTCDANPQTGFDGDIAADQVRVRVKANPPADRSEGVELQAISGFTDNLAYGGGDGSSGDPYQIVTVTELQHIGMDAANDVTGGKYYRLMNNLDLGGVANWTPIGADASHPFRGHFDGGGYNISHLSIGTEESPDAALDYLGLFGYADGAAIHHLNLEDVAIHSSRQFAKIGGLVGYANGGTVQYCSATGNVSGGEDAAAGGLAGYIDVTAVRDSHTNVSVEVITADDVASDYIYAGGLAGYSHQGTIERSYATGSAEAGYFGSGTGWVNHYYVGGLVGYNDGGVIKNSYSSGTVLGGQGPNAADRANIGGLAGAHNNGGSIINCYATGNVGTVSGAIWYTGGLTGENNGGSIQNSYASCRITPQSVYGNGGLIGHYFGGAITNSYWNSDIGTATKGIGTIESGTDTTIAKTSAEMQNGDMLALLNRHRGSNARWKIIPGTNGDYPVLLNISQGVDRSGYTDWYYDDPDAAEFTVSTAAEIAYFAELVNTGTDFSGKIVNIAADIDLSVDINSEEWWPIGDASGSPFRGTFDGHGHAISNLRIGAQDDADTTLSYAGLFGYTDGAVIRNVDVDVAIYSSWGYGYIGGLVGCNNGGAIENCHMTGSVTSGGNDAYTGGLIGDNSGTIENFYAAGNVTTGGISAHAGGLAGGNGGGIHNSYATGSVIAGDNAFAGGLAGKNSGTIEESYATGDATAGNGAFTGAGGLVGNNDGGTIRESHAAGNATAGNNTDGDVYVGGLIGRAYHSTIEDSYAEGSVTGGDEVYTGGLVGYFFSGYSVTNCYARGNVTGGNNGYIGGLVGYITSTTSLITNSYATGDVAGGSGSYVGGLAGYRSTGSTLTYLYWNSDAAQTVNGAAQEPKKGVGSGTDASTAKTSGEMQNEAFVTLLNDNRGENAQWMFVPGRNDGYPTFDYAALYAPDAPTNPVVDDDDDTFGWTNVPGYDSYTDYEYSVDGGSTWHDCTANPQPVGNNAYDAGTVRVRVKADGSIGRPAGEALASDQPFTLADNTPPAPTNPVVDDVNDTFGWTNVSGWGGSYEYSVDNGYTWHDCTGNPQYIGNHDYPTGTVQVRLKAYTCSGVEDFYGSHPTGQALASDAPFTCAAASIASAVPTSLTEAAANDGSLTSGEIVITIANGTLAADIAKADVTAANLPSGLDYTVTRTDATHLTISISGSAANHADADDVSNLTFTIAQAKVDGATGDLTTQNIGIDFDNPEAPAAPTDPTVDDANNTFGWTNVPGFADISDYEYSVDSGSTWNDCTANPQPVGDSDYAAGAVRVRVKADAATGRPAGETLASDAPFTATPEAPVAPTNPVTDDENNTFGWTNAPGFTDPSDYEYTKNGGTTWSDCTANPQAGFDGNIAANQVRVRVKADPLTGRPAGAALQATEAFTANPTAYIVSTVPTSLTEAAANDGSLASGTITVTIANGTLAADIAKADVSAAHLPNGFDYTVTRTDATHLTVNLTGKAVNHATTDSVDNLTFIIAQAKVDGATGDLTTENISIDFDNPEAPAAPTNPVVDDANNTFGWTNVPGFGSYMDCEYSVDSGASWNSCTANPQPVGDSGYAAGAVRVRVKADAATGRPAGAALLSDAPFTASPAAPHSHQTLINPQTLADPGSGISVTGSIRKGARLSVTELGPASDAYKRLEVALNDGQEIILSYEISLSAGGNKPYSGALTLSFPVGAQYNGQTLTVLHDTGGSIERYTGVVANGILTVTVDSLSPFAVARSESASGLPDSHTLYAGGRVTWTPSLSGGTWQYDAAYLTATANGSSMTFSAINTGTTTVAYSVNGMTHAISVTILEAELPKTGQDFTAPILLLILAVCAGGLALALGIYMRKKGRI